MTSWYDPGIVTAEGEAILARYDDWAIKVLRRHALVWSGWTGIRLRTRYVARFGDDWGVRLLDGEDWSQLRLFLLSLLWRAAVSRLPEFAEIVIPQADIDAIGQMLVEGNAEPFHRYPATLIQLTTRGPRHNHAPISAWKDLPAVGPILPRRVRFFRFFMEGLIVHMEVDFATTHALTAVGPSVVGAGDQLAVLARPYEGSWQAENLATIMVETFATWPHMRPHILGAMVPPRRSEFRKRH